MHVCLWHLQSVQQGPRIPIMARGGTHAQPRDHDERPNEKGVRSFCRGLQHRFVHPCRSLRGPTNLLLFAYSATLPHEKFYHMEAYEKRMNALRSGEYVPPAEDGYDPTADMRDLQSKHKRTAVEHDSYLNKDQLQALRKVQQERIEVRHSELSSWLALPYR